MSLGMVGTNYGAGVNYNKYSAAKTKAKSDKTFEMGSATREATGNGDGKNIGVMAIGNQAYLAQYSENSTLANPIVKVGDYEISVNDVDPENATEFEMFALMSHLDKTGQSRNEGMSSFSKMRTYSQQAERNGFVVVLLMLVKHGTANEIGLKLLKMQKNIFTIISTGNICVNKKCVSLLDVMQTWIENRK